MRSSFKLEAVLKQYTPILHFQGNTEGACLRASEVKPKLDRFIFEYLKKEIITIPESWKLKTPEGDNGRIPSFQYKLQIAGLCEPIVSYNTQDKNNRNSKRIHPLYFGSMGDDKFEDNPDDAANPRSILKGLFFPAGVRVSVFSTAAGTILLNDQKQYSLLELIQKLFVPFFALHSFGTRSNKGFGAFGIKSINGKDCSSILPKQLMEYLPKEIPALYYLTYPSEPQANNYLDNTQAISSLMKGGVNFTHGDPGSWMYVKGAIFTYFMRQNNGLHSEKAWIKKNVLPNYREDAAVQALFAKPDISTLPEDAFLFMRGLLGLPQTYTYKRDRDNGHSFRAGTVTVKGHELVQDNKPVIERFENPVHFKPSGKFLLIIPQVIPSKIFGAEIELLKEGQEYTTQTIRIPAPGSFKLDDFLTYFCGLMNDATSDFREFLEKAARTTGGTGGQGGFGYLRIYANLHRLCGNGDLIHCVRRG